MIRKYLYNPCALLLLLLCGCTADSEYSMWPCAFAFDNSIYLDDVLSTAMDAGSRGVFCRISEETRQTVRGLNFTSSDGRTSRVELKGNEMRTTYVLGLNNGIIVGYQTLNTDGRNAGFVGYDEQCPNCVRNTNNTVNPNYRVSMSTAGIATCRRCNKRYDLNNGGIILDGEKGDKGLEKYEANTTGPFGFIRVNRR